MALHGDGCYCGSMYEYPPKGSLVDDDNCNHRCAGFMLDACRGLSKPGRSYSVWNLGIDINLGFWEDEGAGSASNKSTKKAYLS